LLPGLALVLVKKIEKRKAWAQRPLIFVTATANE
jgi:hypothetical protein